MNFPSDEIVVLDMAGVRAVVKCENHSLISKLQEIGFIFDGENFIIEPLNDDKRKKVILDLIELNSLFSVGAGWSPAELLEYYVEKGIISKRYRTISWTNPDCYVIRDT